MTISDENLKIKIHFATNFFPRNFDLMNLIFNLHVEQTIVNSGIQYDDSWALITFRGTNYIYLKLFEYTLRPDRGNHYF